MPSRFWTRCPRRTSSWHNSFVRRRPEVHAADFRLRDAYDRLDRLSRLPHGQQTVRDLIRGPDGYKMIEYMTTAPGGKELGNQLSNAPQGKDFNAATGRIYTAEKLLLRLEQSRAAAS